MTPTETKETNVTAEAQAEAAHAEDHKHEHHHAAPTLNPELTREIELEVDADAVSKAFRSVVKRYQKLARIPGFRAGKVPESLIRSKFAREVRQEVLEGLVSERFRKALEEHKLRPVSEPQLLDLQLLDGQPLKFKAAFEVSPDFSVTGYDAVKIAKPDVALTNEEFEAELDRFLESHATIEPVEEDRSLADGDWAEIHFRGEFRELAQTVTDAGLESPTRREPVTGEDVLIEVGGKNTLPAFNEALRGSRPGQELKFEVEYPADFGEKKLAGQAVSYDVTVKGIKRKTYPERDDEFARQLGEFDSWNEFESRLREQASNRKKRALESQAKDKLLDEFVQKYQFPVPETFVQQQVDARLDRGLRALAAQGMTPDEMRKLDFGHLREAQRDQALNEVKASMILDRIAEAENVTVSDEDLERELLLLSIQSREPLENLRGRLQKEGGLDRIREQLRREKTAGVLYEKLAS